ncbi:MAG TPA: TOMM precursor leader peptide-binding protein, partial [Thermoanaerobaculia bacterium]|nr:TOMM precursor leader peptide-binding protein [Thermoanaerobaculia bacterium]
RTTSLPGGFSVVLTGDYLDPELAAVNRAALDRGDPWMIVKTNGAVAWIGPIFQPGQTACWECLAARLRANREVENWLEQQGRPRVLFTHAVPTALNVAANMAAIQIARFLTEEQSELTGTLITLDLASMQTVRHYVQKRPQCAACGDPDLLRRAPREITLQSRAKRFTADGGHRANTPDETFLRYSHLVGPITGVVRNLTPVTAPDDDIAVYIAGHNFALQSDSLNFLRRSLRTNSAGKGKTAAQARTSAMCEAIERYSGVWRGEEPRITATARGLGSVAILPNDCMLYSDKQFRERDAWNARGAQFQIVPRPFDAYLAVEWSPLWSLTRSEVRFLPSAYLYYCYPATPETFHCWADSNGNASGNTLEEAIVQGFFELVERDAVAIWWYNRLRRRGVDFDSFDDPYLGIVRERYRRHGRDVWALDLTSDLGYPTFVSVSRQLDGPTEDLVMGFGAHHDARIALLRAVTEMNQFLPAVLGKDRDGNTVYGFDDPETVRWWKTATIENQPYVVPDPMLPPAKASDFPYQPTDDLRDDVLACKESVERLGLEMLVLDQTRPDIGLSVAKVIVPGMRHFWARFAPGRLYDVPVRMGWRDTPINEDDVNPIAMFI